MSFFSALRREKVILTSIYGVNSRKVNMTITDVIFAFSCLIFLCTGWQKGFLRTILGPVSLILGAIISYIYYLYTKNLIVSLVIGILGPFFLKMALSLGLNVWNKTVSNRMPAPLLSRLSGSLFNLLWSGGLLLLCLLLVVMIPANLFNFNIEKIQSDIRKSLSFSFIGKGVLNKVLGIEDVHETLTIFNNEGQMEKLKNSKEFHALAEDQRVQDVLHDETTLKQIQDKDFVHLVTNPKMLSLLNDPSLMKKLMAVHAQMMKEGYVVDSKSEAANER